MTSSTDFRRMAVEAVEGKAMADLDNAWIDHWIREGEVHDSVVIAEIKERIELYFRVASAISNMEWYTSKRITAKFADWFQREIASK